MLRVIVTAVTVGLFCHGLANAQDASYSAKVQRACTPDANRLCPQHVLGSPEMRYCMEAKQRSISRECLIALEDDGIIPRGSVKSAAKR